LDGREQNPGGVPRTPRVVHTPAKRLRHEKGRNSRKKRKTIRERTSVYREIEKYGNLDERKRERVYQQEKEEWNYNDQ